MAEARKEAPVHGQPMTANRIGVIAPETTIRQFRRE